MKILTIICLFGIVHFAAAQNPHTAQLKKRLSTAKDDTSKVLIMSDISASYRFSKFDSSMWYGQHGLELAKRMRYIKGEGRCLANIARILAEQGNTPLALKYDLEALQLNKDSKDQYGEIQTLNSTGLMFVVLENYKEGRTYFYRAKNMYAEKNIADNYGLIVSFLNTGWTFLMEKRLDSAEFYLSKSYELLKQSKVIHSGSLGNPTSFIVRIIGQLQEQRGHEKEALQYYWQSIREALVENDLRSLSLSYQLLSDWFRGHHQLDSSIYYAGKSLQTARYLHLMSGIFSASTGLAELYKIKGNKDSTLKYMSLELAAKDSLFNPERIRQIEILNFTEQQRLQQVQEEQRRLNNRVKLYSLLAGVIVSLFCLFILWKNNRRQKKANKLLQQQRNQISKTLNELKLTQTQLIQSEKMASLGELTAGIAHEIQNPLNFVNNFSEVNREMLEELEQEIKNGNAKEALAITADIVQNEKKINHHGKRADSIVKGMLQHSRSTSGQKEITDINGLVDEYLRLAYHGLRAKDKSFNVELATNFDKTLPPINVVPQDIGRVLINLFTNAFYALNQKKQFAGNDFRPELSVTTTANNGQVIIKVKDNGIGIAGHIKDKVMQPFFTTKPTGEGTGLGLSLSYDIVVKGHAGEIRLNSKDGEFTEFILTIPDNL